MALKRIIPVVLVKEGLLVRSQKFKYHQAIGDPIPTIKRLSDWNADEIILLNISENTKLDSRRSDKYHNLGTGKFSDLVRETAKFCHCPITIGGGVREIKDIRELFEAGADKVAVNTLCFTNASVVKRAIEKYGAQAITGAIDTKITNNEAMIYIENGKKNTGIKLSEGLKRLKDLGVGEILISSIDHDGSESGYSKEIFANLDENETTPIIINSGAKKPKHFIEA